MRKLLKYLTVAGLFVLFSAGISSCGDKVYYENGADMETIYFTVKPNEWEWNRSAGRYECTFTSSKLDDYMYQQQGAVIGGVYIQESGRETLKTLPYVHSYVYEDENGDDVYYTETFHFDISRNGRITFYFQNSDLSDIAPLEINYDFKITLFWQI